MTRRERRFGRKQPWLAVADEVVAALAAGRPVVALESSLVAHGLPAPHNLQTARDAERAVRDAGAVPATVAIEAGRLVVGASPALLERLADPDAGAEKAASGDIGPLLAGGRLAGTTVSATMRAAHLAGITCFATGGIGGVHRTPPGTPADVSADLDELAATPLAVVCSGAKSILDLPATLEALETRRVPVVGLGVDQLPAFHAASSGLPLAHVAADLAEAAKMTSAHLAVGGGGAILLVQPPPAAVALSAAEVGRWIDRAIAEAEEAAIRGNAVTPFVLRRLGELSGGRTLATNVALVLGNARAAAEIAVLMAGR